MSGETGEVASGWTTDTLHAHLLSLVNERDRRYEQRFEAQEHARSLQATEYERRLSDLNHAHEQARQKERDYVTLDKYEDYISQSETAREAALLRVDEKVSSLETWRSKTMGAVVVLTLIAGVIGAVIAKALGA